MSSASAADCTHCRANSSNPGATSEKQLFQSSWLAIFSMTFSRSLCSRRRQPMILSNPAKLFLFVAWMAMPELQAEDVDLEKAVGSFITAKKAYAKLAGEKGFIEVSKSALAAATIMYTPR